MKLFLSYLKSKCHIIAYLCLCPAVFCVSFALFRLPMAAVWYPMLLCAIILLIFAGLGFRRYALTHRHLSSMTSLPPQLIRDFPHDCVGLEPVYREIIRAMQERMSEDTARSEARYRDMMDYFTVWAHQIKIPISAMHLTLQAEDSAAARKLTSELYRTEQYVNMVLTFLRLDDAHSDFVFHEVDLDSILRPCVRRFSSEFIGRRIGLEYVPLETSIVSDEKWLSFILEQILSNALKYTREGRIRISMRNENVLCIEDTGIGIAPDDLPRVFEKGYTGCNGRLDRRASGIGLYLCKRICEKLSIGIRVESEIGKGTTVLLDLTQHRVDSE